ncbi:MAG: hypothetical protein J6I96_04745 [Oscillospiraceae bacterium]|nr:hypothetical protein [Oscillospiraceae bacterium]
MGKIITAVIATAVCVCLCSACAYNSADKEMQELIGSVVSETSVPYTDYDKDDLGTLDKYITLTCEGLTLDVPEGLHNDSDHKSEHDTINDLRRRTYFSGEDHKDSEYVVIFQEPCEIPFDDTVDDIKKKHGKAYDRFLGKLGLSEINDHYDFCDVLYSLEKIDVNKLSKKEKSVYNEFAVFRQILASSENKHTYRFKKDGFRGFVYDWSEDKVSFIVEISSDKEPNNMHSVIISAPDTESAYKIINSIRMDE